jgi:hypothetical protein
MNRALISRVAGVLAIAATALLGAGAANAQVSPHQPGSQIQAASVAVKTAGTQAVNATQTDDSFSASSCGYWQSGVYGPSYYTHCGSYDIQIRVKSGSVWWPNYTDMWVMPGTTNLTDHWALWGKGRVVNAWCISRC